MGYGVEWRNLCRAARASLGIGTASDGSVVHWAWHLKALAQEKSLDGGGAPASGFRECGAHIGCTIMHILESCPKSIITPGQSDANGDKQNGGAWQGAGIWLNLELGIPRRYMKRFSHSRRSGGVPVCMAVVRG